MAGETSGSTRCPDPTIEEPTDAIVRITSTGLCGSDLHLYEVMAPFMTEGDILGHEPMGIVEAVGARGDPHRARRPGRDPVQHLVRSLRDVRTSGCSRSARRPRSASTTRAQRCSATPSCTARSRAGRPSCCGSRKRSTDRSRSRTARRTTASCTCPTCCRRPGRPCSTPAIPDGGTVVVLGLGPIGSMACRVAQHLGASRVIGVDLVPERLERAAQPRRRGARPALDLDDPGRRRRRHPRPAAQHRARQRDRRRRHGGPRFRRRQARPAAHGAAAGQGDGEADDPRRRRPARRAAAGDRARAARRHDLARPASTAA